MACVAPAFATAGLTANSVAYFRGRAFSSQRPHSHGIRAPMVDVGPAKDDPPTGLTSDEARRRLQQFGPNAMPDMSAHPLRMALEKFWAPVPWMLEAAIVLELALGK